MADTWAKKFIKGTVTTDGAGAGSASIVTTGYRLRGITIRPVSITGGTVTAIPSGGANLLPATSIANATRRAFGSPTVATSPLAIAITGGGATKQFRYEVELVR